MCVSLHGTMVQETVYRLQLIITLWLWVRFPYMVKAILAQMVEFSEPGVRLPAVFEIQLFGRRAPPFNGDR